MKHLHLLALPSLMFVLALLSGCGSSPDEYANPAHTGEQAAPAADLNTATAKAQDWLAQLGGKPLHLEANFSKPQQIPVVGSQSSLIEIFEGGYHITLGLQKSLPAGATAADFKAAFKYIALNQLPTPGLDIPSWRFQPQTPLSSFSEGVHFEDVGNLLKVRVQTTAFALYGRKQLAEPHPADAPLPAGSYLQITQPIGLSLNFTLRVPASKP